MTLAAFAFAAGAALLQWQARLPGLEWAWALPVVALIAFRWRRALFVFTLALGFMWAALLAHQRMADILPPELEGRDIDVVGVVSSLPALGERSVRFELDVESTGGGERLPKKILLSWYRSAAFEDQASVIGSTLHPGE